ncbi:MAG TPA: lysophospholipid acyltransferase family protein [Thermoanaerobaculaceae bacterium]|nr:lysophospholipid acyltransferase family protein [Thermoanaerobaculaceae bacterium]
MPKLARKVRHDLGYALLRVLLAGARLFPLGALRGVGWLTGRAAFPMARRDRGRALAHIARAFPEHGERWRRALASRCAGHLGKVLGEVAWLWSASPQAILAKTDFEGVEHLTGDLGPQRGAIFVTGHCGNWEWLNLALGASGVPMTVAAREVYDPRLDEVARRLRSRFGGESALRGKDAGGRLVRALRKGRVIGLLIDQDIDAPGVFVEFFGQPAWTPSGAALLALRTGCPIVTGFATRLPDGRMRASFSPPVEIVRSPDLDADVAALTATLTAHIERQVRASPEQWVWMHRRWKHQPGEGEKVWRAGGEQGLTSLNP